MKEIDKKQDQAGSDVTPLVLSCDEVRKVFAVCDVCGYANPEFTAQCQKCSNFLQ